MLFFSSLKLCVSVLTAEASRLDAKASNSVLCLLNGITN